MADPQRGLGALPVELVSTIADWLQSGETAGRDERRDFRNMSETCVGINHALRTGRHEALVQERMSGLRVEANSMKTLADLRSLIARAGQVFRIEGGPDQDDRGRLELPLPDMLAFLAERAVDLDVGFREQAYWTLLPSVDSLRGTESLFEVLKGMYRLVDRMHLAPALTCRKALEQLTALGESLPERAHEAGTLVWRRCLLEHLVEPFDTHYRADADVRAVRLFETLADDSAPDSSRRGMHLTGMVDLLPCLPDADRQKALERCFQKMDRIDSKQRMPFISRLSMDGLLAAEPVEWPQLFRRCVAAAVEVLRAVVDWQAPHMAREATGMVEKLRRSFRQFHKPAPAPNLTSDDLHAVLDLHALIPAARRSFKALSLSNLPGSFSTAEIHGAMAKVRQLAEPCPGQAIAETLWDLMHCGWSLTDRSPDEAFLAAKDNFLLLDRIHSDDVGHPASMLSRFRVMRSHLRPALSKATDDTRVALLTSDQQAWLRSEVARHRQRLRLDP